MLHPNRCALLVLHMAFQVAELHLQGEKSCHTKLSTLGER